MFKTLLLALLLSSACTYRQQILLVGTFHKTPPDRTDDVVPVARALHKFKPKVLCVEYPIPVDTASWRLQNEFHFQRLNALAKEWKVDIRTANIDLLKTYVESHPRDLKARMRLMETYYLSNDMANADFQCYLTFNNAGTTSKYELSVDFPSYSTFRDNFERHRLYASEHYLLVFPLAESLRIDHLYAIDDLSTWDQYEKYDERMKHSYDSTALIHGRTVAAFREKMLSLPKGQNLWLFANSISLKDELLALELYTISPAEIENDDMLKRHHFWVHRNTVIAQHIINVALQTPRKKIAVFLGVSHIWPVMEELKKFGHRYRVRTLEDLVNLQSN